MGCKFLEGKSLDSSEGLDQALLLMTSEMPTTLTPYFNGWDRGYSAPKSGVGIHHPKGVVKKISTYISPAVSGTWPSIGVGGGVNGHWLVEFTSTANGFSATEGGSSGSPLFNQNKLVVGALTGGSSSCSNPTGSNYYGKIQRFWPYISKYLDPLNNGVYTLPGVRKGEIVPSPKALNVKWSEGVAELSWLPLEDDPTNYIIYRNGLIIGHPISNTFVDNNLYTGKHTYQVSAYYAETGIETRKSNASILIKHPIVTPSVDIVERISNNNAVINWTLPQSEQKIFWGGEQPTLKLKTHTKYPIYFGQMWSASDLSEVNEYVIKRVETSCLANIDYTLYIRQGANIYTQQIPITTEDKDVVITLEKEFVLNNSEPLYCVPGNNTVL